VRELENVVERTMVLVDGEEIGYHDLPLTFDEGPTEERAGGTDDGGLQLNERLDEVERDLIARAMEEAQHVKTKAASLLGIKTSALYYKLDKYGLD
jgi:two-component system response regulator HydG